jgi:hypothetical protein
MVSQVIHDRGGSLSLIGGSLAIAGDNQVADSLILPPLGLAAFATLIHEPSGLGVKATRVLYELHREPASYFRLNRYDQE